jgi:hypothetical protein
MIIEEESSQSMCEDDLEDAFMDDRIPVSKSPPVKRISPS